MASACTLGSMDELRILIAGDNPLARAGLGAMLEGYQDCHLVGQVAGDETLLDQLDVLAPDILVWDIGWEPDIQHLASLSETEYPIVALVPDAEQAGRIWSTGIQGILLRSVTSDRLMQVLRSIAMDLIVIEPALLDTLSLSSPDLSVLDVPLTPREIEVLQLMAEGLSNKGIGFQLGISDHTVKFHVNSIMTKLEAQSRTEAAVKATRLGLIMI